MLRSHGPVFHDMESMVLAGFERVEPQPHTKVIVTRHPKLKGYIIKAYLDEQQYYAGKPENYYWVKRVEGANLIRKAIKKHNYSHLIKVPTKWIYKLPETPAPFKPCLRIPRTRRRSWVPHPLGDPASKAAEGSATAAPGTCPSCRRRRSRRARRSRRRAPGRSPPPRRSSRAAAWCSTLRG